MTRSAWILAVGPSSALDVFVARTAALALKWLSHELEDREILSAALAGRLQVTLRCLDGAGSTQHDLRRWLFLELEDLPRVALTSTAGLERLRRRLDRRPEESPTLHLDERECLGALPAPNEAPMAHDGVVEFEGRHLTLGAHLARPGRQLADVDPPPERGPADSAAVRALFDAVYTEPDDDGLRTVLADALLELGDPRGRFIHEQLQRASTGRQPSQEERRLLERHEETWLGELKHTLSRVEWGRGFPEAARLAATRLRRAELSTLRRVRLWNPGRALESLEGLTRVTRLVGLDGGDLALLDGFGRLRELALTGELTRFGQPTPALLAFAQRPPPALRRLEVVQSPVETENGGRLLSGPGRLLDASDWSWLFSTALGRQLEHFAASSPFEVLASWLRLAPALPVPLLTLRVTQYLDFSPLVARLRRDSATLEVSWRRVPEPYDDGRDTFALLLEEVEASGVVQRVEVEHPDPPPTLLALERRGAVKLIAPAEPHPAPLLHEG